MVNFLKPEQIDTFKEGDPKGVAGYEAWFKEENQPKEYPEVEEHIDSGLPAKRDPFDPKPLIALLEKYQGEIHGMIVKAKELKVVDDTSLATANDMLNQASTFNTIITKKHAELKRPYLDVTQPLDAFKKTLADMIGNIVNVIKPKMTPYMQEVKRKQDEAARKAQEEAARIQKELDEKAAADRQKAADEAKAAALAAGMSDDEAAQEGQAAASLVEDAPVVVAQAVPEETKIQTDTGTAKLKESWDFEIVNFFEMPDQAFDARKVEVVKALTPWVRAQINAGARNIPGVKIFKVAKVNTRVSRGSF
uniref:Uncharacterized protein n=1 Tax=viral metagenome TaxID=1070528 RepID=A0A6H1ZS48_9ZZZZ